MIGFLVGLNFKTRQALGSHLLAQSAHYVIAFPRIPGIRHLPLERGNLANLLRRRRRVYAGSPDLVNTRNTQAGNREDTGENENLLRKSKTC